MLRNKKNILPVVLTLWVIINVIQAWFTGLFFDEAYYYFYARDLAWGYYDHPPMVALLIRIGNLISSNELGVRLLFILMSAGTLLVLYRTLEPNNPRLFFILVFSFMIYQVTGFLAFPDSPLLFFTALFFLFYKKYIETYDTKNAVLLGVIMAGMFYSKYLGIFIVFFTLISNPDLWKKRSAWFAVLVATLLYLPHLLWQFNHQFPSVYYHFTERSHDEMFRWKNIGEYLIGQAGLINPILLIPVIYFLFIFKPADRFGRALKFAAAGYLLFPFLLMIKGRVEANWTMAGLVPLLLITLLSLEKKPKWRRFFELSGAISIFLVIMVRLFLMFDILPVKIAGLKKPEVHGWKEFSEHLGDIAGDRPVVFNGSYQNPSMYNFYTGKEAFSFNNALYRSNQYDLENLESSLQGREVLVVFPKNSLDIRDIRHYGIALNDSIRYPNGKYRHYLTDTNYRSYNYMPVKFSLPSATIRAGETFNIRVSVLNPGTEPVDFSAGLPKETWLACYLLQHGKPVIYEKFENISGLVLREEYLTECTVRAPDIPGTYYVKISIKCGWMPPGINNRLVKIEVE